MRLKNQNFQQTKIFLMNPELEIKKSFKEKFLYFYLENKKKIIFLVFLLLIFLISLFFFNYNNNKNNLLISEKYTQAGIYLSEEKKFKSKEIYEEIIFSKNKFYSTLALNTIIERNLERDKNKILNYFEVVENLNQTQDQKDLLTFKKALFLLKNQKIQEGNELLKELKGSNSRFKSLAEELLTN